MIVISPAKRQNESSHLSCVSQPQHLVQTKEILDDISGWSVDDTKRALNLSEALSYEAYDKNQALANSAFDPAKAISALGMYVGDVYKFLDVPSLSEKEIDFLQNELRIISAMYGLLRPLDGIWPYRLEMGSKLPNHNSLVEYWKAHVTDAIVLEAPEFIINLASQEYSSCIDTSHISKMIDIVFQDKGKNGQYRVIAVKAKRMRGVMLRYIAQNQIMDPQQLVHFEENGYVFNELVSSPSRLVFQTR